MLDRVKGADYLSFFPLRSARCVQSNRVRNIHSGVFDLRGPFRLRQKRSRNQLAFHRSHHRGTLPRKPRLRTH